MFTKHISSDNIYFDGYLPAHKQETRFKRLESNRQELRKFKAKHPEGVPILSDTSQLASASITTSTFVDKPFCYHRGIPAAPFLVASVIETILESKYAAVTDVVPGEADTFCAVAARKAGRGALILTNDSDLLIHDTGPDGSIAFLTQVEISTEDGDTKHSKTCDTIRVNCFRSLEIAQRLDLENCKRLAFEIKCNPSTTLQAAIQCTKRPPLDASALEEFLSEFDPELSVLDGSQQDRGLDWDRQIYRYLDPRVSELVLQLINQTSIQPINIYLPSLIEDPDRASAWSSTAEDRAFTYSCLQHYSKARHDSTKSSNHGQTTKDQIRSSPHPNENTPNSHIPSTFKTSKNLRNRTPHIPCNQQPSTAPSKPPYASEYPIPTPPSNRPISEIFRKGDRTATTPITLLNKPALTTHASYLSQSIQSHQKTIPLNNLTTPYGFWRSYAVSRATGSDPEVWTEKFHRLLKGDKEAGFWSWGDVHSVARIEAVLYSLRILRQVLGVLIGRGVSLPEVLVGLDQVLATLPPLRMMMGTRVEVLRWGESEF